MNAANQSPNPSDIRLQTAGTNLGTQPVDSTNNPEPKSAASRPQLKVVPPATPTPATAPPSVSPQTETQPEKQSGSSWQKWATLGLVAVAIGGVGFIPISHNVSGETIVESAPGYQEIVNMPEPGTIKKIYVHQNSPVIIGQPIIEIKSDEVERLIDDIDQKLIQAKSELQSADVQISVLSSNREQYQIKYHNSIQRSARLHQEIAQNQQPRVQQLESDKAGRISFSQGLQVQVARLDKRISELTPAVKAGAISRKEIDNLEDKKQEILTQLAPISSELAAIDAQIADATKQRKDELLDQRQPEVDDAAAALQSASTQIQKAKADKEKWSAQIPQLDAIKQKLLQRREKLTVRATKNGVVIDPNLETLEGQKLPDSKPILTITDPNHPSAIVELTQEDYKLVKIGMPVIFRPQDAEFNEYKARVEELPPTVSFDQAQQKRSVKVRLKFDDEKAAAYLMLGTKGNAHIQVEQMRVYHKLQREFLKLFPISKFV